MARVEPMDLDVIESDFENKENTFHINNALPRSPCFEKVHEYLDVSEVKHLCSFTQRTSSMSKTFTANIDKKISYVEDHHIVNSNSNLTRSLNSTLANCNGLLKSPKSMPLQSITTSRCTDFNKNTIDKGSFDDKSNINLNIDGADMESLSLPSSSLGHTPEATTPIKDIPMKNSKRNCTLKESEIVNKSDVDCISADQSVLEDQSSIRVSTAAIESGMLHDNCTIYKKKTMDDLYTDIGDVKDNIINKIDLKNILQLIQATDSTEICNNTFDNQNIEKDVSKDNIVERLIVCVKNNKSLTNIINSDLKYQAHNSFQKHPVSISEPFYETKNIISEYNIFNDERVCLQPDILNENQILAFEGSSKKVSSTHFMYDHTPQEDFIQAALSKKEYESSAHNKKCDAQVENKTFNSSANLANDKNIMLNKLRLPNSTITGDNNLTEENWITDLKNDFNVEINVMKALDSNSTIINECDITKEVFEINFTETQEPLCITQKLDQDDLEVENINNSQSTCTVVLDNPFETKSKLLKSPLTTTGIEAKNDNNQVHNTQASVDHETYTELKVRKELTNRLSALESRVKTLEYENEDRLRKIKDLSNQISEKNEQKKNMVTVVEKYEWTIITLIAELEQSRKQHAEQRMLRIENHKELTGHLSILELSFNDLLSKYQKSKKIILSLKANEDCLKKALQESEDNQVKFQNIYEVLKQHAIERINYANQDLEKLKKGHQAQILKLQAMMKRKDLQISSLEDTIAQKTKANEELITICDDLLKLVG